jgi:glycine dehydrogenase subunit 1
MQYIPSTAELEKELLTAIGVSKFEDLLVNIPKEFIAKCRIQLPEALSEVEISHHLSQLAAKNKNSSTMISFLGGGAYDHFVPAVVDFLISRSEFYTAYTPYQPEVSQGTLQSIYEYQSMVCHLLDMEVANASMYDGATALAEAAIACTNINNRNKVLVSPLINPQYLSVLKTYMGTRDVEIQFLPEKNGQTDFSQLVKYVDQETAGLLVQSPNFLGIVEDLQNVAQVLHDHQALLVVDADPIAASILKTPGEWGADIAVAEGQPLGIHQSFGGPYLGVFTARKAMARKMPGRIVGETIDVDGKRGYVLVLQTREQHIRREKATSNICTNQGLMALAATIYLALMGKEGLKQVASLCLNYSHYLAQQIQNLKGFGLAYPDAPFFKEFVVRTPVKPRLLIDKAQRAGIFAGIELEPYRDDWQSQLLIAVTEKRTRQEMDEFVRFLSNFK